MNKQASALLRATLPVHTFQVGRSFLRDPDWIYCDFTCYINWLVQYVQVGSTTMYCMLYEWA